MADDDLFFVSRGGHIWACWLSGKPAVDLGVDTEVTAAMTQFLRELRARVSSSASMEAPPPPLPQPAFVVSPSIPPAPRSAVIQPRAADRHDLTILGRIFTARGSRDVTILDLSETGCQFHAAGSQLKADNHLTIKLGPVGPIEATVRWNRGDRHGVQFNSTLYPSVLQHIRDHFDLRKR